MLQFLKELPDKYLLTFLVLVVLATYIGFSDDFLQRLLDTLIGALIASVVGTFKSRGTSSVDVGNVEKVELKTNREEAK